MDSLKAVEVRRVPLSEDLMKPGDFVFIAKREPVRKFESVPLQPPAGFFRRLWWNWFGQKFETKQIIELIWPERDAVIVNCPKCSQPCATTKKHKIISIDPLTIETPITCPYESSPTFTIAEGTIML